MHTAPLAASSPVAAGLAVEWWALIVAGTGVILSIVSLVVSHQWHKSSQAQTRRLVAAQKAQELALEALRTADALETSKSDGKTAQRLVHLRRWAHQIRSLGEAAVADEIDALVQKYANEGASQANDHTEKLRLAILNSFRPDLTENGRPWLPNSGHG